VRRLHWLRRALILRKLRVQVRLLMLSGRLRVLPRRQEPRQMQLHRQQAPPLPLALIPLRRHLSVLHYPEERLPHCWQALRRGYQRLRLWLLRHHWLHC
jgi:hypothetical protein